MSNKPLVCITDFVGVPPTLHYGATSPSLSDSAATTDLAVEQRILGDIAEIRALGAEREDELTGRIEDATCIMMYHFLQMGAATIGRLKLCKLIVRCGVGIDNVDHAAARACGIPVCNIPDYGTGDVADTAIAMMTTLARGTHLLNSRLRSGIGIWSYTQAVPVHRLRGRTFAIVGMGRIGTAAAHRAKALGMEVVFYDPYVSPSLAREQGVRRVETLEELLAQAHVLSLHCPATPETIGMIGHEQIARMPRGSFVINTARGTILDTSAIPPAIRSGQLAGAGIDVLPMEPPLKDDALVAAWRDPNDPCHDRVIITPHAAFYSEDGMMDIRVKASECCRKALLGQPLPNVVN